MASSGEQMVNSSTTVDSESNSEMFCSPCQSDGKRLSAVGYCETCKSSLCERCFDCHTVPVPMRKHRLLKGEQTLVEHEVIKDKSQCTKHEGEAILFHCPAHSILGCYICSFRHQKTCREVIYIPDISETITSSDEFKEFMTKLDHTAETSKKLVDECKRNITLVEQCHTDAIAAIKAFKLELLETIEQLENKLYEKAELIKQQSVSRWNSVVEKHLQLQTELKAISTGSEILQKKNRKNDLYISMVKSKNLSLSLETEFNTAKGEKISKPFNFEANTEILETLKSSNGLGKLRIMADVVKTEHIKDINVKLENDKNTCIITGSSVLPEHKLVIADCSNNNMKVIDTKQLKVLSAMTLSSSPWGLAKLENSRVVVALPYEKKITFIRTDPALSIDTHIGVDGDCYGVAYSDGKLVVSFNSPHKVEIMDVKGSVLRRIQTDGNGQALFNYPYSIAINPQRSVMYVSNYGTGDVVCLRFDETVVATYNDDELRGPMQVIVDSTGNVYVCAQDSNDIHQLTEDCKKVKVLLSSADGLRTPRTISYDETEGMLYAGQYSNDNVKAYRMIFDYL